MKKYFTHRFYLSLIYLSVLSVFFFVSYSKIFDEKIDLNGDNIYYYALGEAIANGQGFVNTIGMEITPHTHFPPGYPAIISVIMNVFGSDFNTIKWANGIMMWLSVIVLFFLFRKISSNIHLAFMVCIFVATNPSLLSSATIMMSEIPYLFLSSLAILLFLYIPFEREKWTHSPKFYILLLSSAILIVFSYFVRSAGITLCIAAVFACVMAAILSFFQNPKQYSLKPIFPYLGTIAFLLILYFGSTTIWKQHQINQGVKNTKMGYLGQLSVKSGGGNMETTKDWEERIVANLTTYIPYTLPVSTYFLGVSYQEKYPTSSWVKGFLLLAFVLWGVFRVKKSLWFFLAYFGSNLIVLLLWPQHWGGTRFIIGLIPFIMFFFVYSIYDILQLILKKLNVKSKTWKEIVLPFFLLLVFATIAQPTYSKAIKERAKQAKFKDYNIFNAQLPFVEYKEMCIWMGANLPPSSIIACRKPELAYIYSKRTQLAGFPQYASPEEVLAGFEREKVTHVVLDHWFRHAFYTVYPCIQAYPEKFTLLKIIGGENNQTPTLLYQYHSDHVTANK